MSKYEPLREHLARLDDVVWAAKLEEVEQIIGSSLPKSAREHRTWWANSGGSLVHQNAWLDAGWRVERTDLMRDVIVFRRLRIGGTVLAGGVSGAGRSAHNPQKAEEKRLAREMASLRQPATVTLRSEWTPLGDVHNTPCSSTTISSESGVLRLAAFSGDSIVTAIVSAGSIQQVYRGVRMATKGHEGEEANLGKALLSSAGIDPGAPIECDMVRPGNAWLLTDGRGRKASLDDVGECRLVAQLLHIQEIQSGRKSALVYR